MPCARPGGFGALVGRTISKETALISTLLATALCGGVGFWLGETRGTIALSAAALISLALGFLWGKSLSDRFSGMTGDMFGAVIEVVTAAFLVCGAILL